MTETEPPKPPAGPGVKEAVPVVDNLWANVLPMVFDCVVPYVDDHVLLSDTEYADSC